LTPSCSPPRNPQASCNASTADDILLQFGASSLSTETEMNF
jgi:hypothetical protein